MKDVDIYAANFDQQRVKEVDSDAEGPPPPHPEYDSVVYKERVLRLQKGEAVEKPGKKTMTKLVNKWIAAFHDALFLLRRWVVKEDQKDRACSSSKAPISVEAQEARVETDLTIIRNILSEVTAAVYEWYRGYSSNEQVMGRSWRQCLSGLGSIVALTKSCRGHGSSF